MSVHSGFRRSQWRMGESSLECGGFLCIRARMEFTALFLGLTAAMLAAWRGSRPLALTLFAVSLAASVATYLHHATDALKLSF